MKWLAIPLLLLISHAIAPLEGWRRWAVIIGAALLASLGVFVGAKADDSHYCLAWAEVAAWIELMHRDDVDLATGPELPRHLYSTAFFKCMNADEAVLPSETQWLKEIRDAIAAKLALGSAGTAPATEAPVPAPAAKAVDPNVAKCRRYYRTFDEKTGTVIRRHNKGRSKCPFL